MRGRDSLKAMSNNWIPVSSAAAGEVVTRVAASGAAGA
jgi:hypothetical protein